MLRRAVVGTAFAASALLLTACGFQAPDVENTEHASVQAVDFTVGTVAIDDAAITSTTSNGVPSFWLQATFVDTGSTSDTLTGATTPNGTVSISSGEAVGTSLTLPPGIPVVVVTPAAGAAGPSISLAMSPSPQLGAYVPIVFTFTDAGTSGTVQVPVIPPGETTAATQPVPSGTASVPPVEGQSADD